MSQAQVKDRTFELNLLYGFAEMPAYILSNRAWPSRFCSDCRSSNALLLSVPSLSRCILPKHIRTKLCLVVLCFLSAVVLI